MRGAGERWLLVDVDGCLCPYELAPGTEYAAWVDPALRYRPGSAAALLTASGRPGVHLGWYTAREEEAPLLLGLPTGMALAPFVPVPDDWADTPAHVKLEGLRRWLAHRPQGTFVVVLDDDLPGHEHWPPGVRFIQAPPEGIGAEHVEAALGLLTD